MPRIELGPPAREETVLKHRALPRYIVSIFVRHPHSFFELKKLTIDIETFTYVFSESPAQSLGKKKKKRLGNVSCVTE